MDEATLSGWKKHPEVLGILASWRDPFKARFGEVASALHRRAVKGHVPAARALADILGENSPDRLEVRNATNLADFLREHQEPVTLPWKATKSIDARTTN